MQVVFRIPFSKSRRIIYRYDLRSRTEETLKQGCHETVMAATIVPILNANRSRADPLGDLGFAAYLHDIVFSNRAKFSKPALNSFGVMSYD